MRIGIRIDAARRGILSGEGNSASLLILFGVVSDGNEVKRKHFTTGSECL